MQKGLKNLINNISSKHWAEQIIDDVLQKQQRIPRVLTNFHASWSGECPRLIQLRMNGMSNEIIEPRVQRIFDTGTSMHDRYKNYFRKADKLVAEEAPIEISCGDFIIIGRADLIVKDTQNNIQVGELKSINSNRFDNIQNIPLEENFLQWNVYTHGLQIYDGFILYENKDNSKIKVFQVKYDDKKFAMVKQVFSMINDCNKKGALVPLDFACPNSRYCEAVKICGKR